MKTRWICLLPLLAGAACANAADERGDAATDATHVAHDAHVAQATHVAQVTRVAHETHETHDTRVAHETHAMHVAHDTRVAHETHATHVAQATHAPRVTPATRAGEPPRLSLRGAQLERAADQAGRFTLRARFAAAESAGELREGGGLALIGRLAKAAVNCGTGTVFRDGFEGS